MLRGHDDVSDEVLVCRSGSQQEVVDNEKARQEEQTWTTMTAVEVWEEDTTTLLMLVVEGIVNHEKAVAKEATPWHQRWRWWFRT